MRSGKSLAGPKPKEANGLKCAPASAPAVPEPDCGLCPRLKAFRAQNREKFPERFNAPVPSFGGQESTFLIVGLAPGLKGANFSGRPFTGDYAGDLLYATLLDFGFARGRYGAAADDGLTLEHCRITNAVRCVPPENKPLGPEIRQCGSFLRQEIAGLKNLRVILSLGLVSHNAVVKATGHKISAFKFAHGQRHDLGTGPSGQRLVLFDSYHCSRYNTNTGRLNEKMFQAVFNAIGEELKQ